MYAPALLLLSVIFCRYLRVGLRYHHLRHMCCLNKAVPTTAIDRTHATPGDTVSKLGAPATATPAFRHAVLGKLCSSNLGRGGGPGITSATHLDLARITNSLNGNAAACATMYGTILITHLAATLIIAEDW